MDQPGLGTDQHEQALRGLRRINFVSASARLLWPPIVNLARTMGTDSLRLLDVASGGGDVSNTLWRKARHQGLRLSIVGCDVSPMAVEYARRQARAAGSDIEFCVRDVLREPLPTGFDGIMSSLFLHHLAHDDAIELLRRMAAASGRAVLINDLRRCLSGYLLAQAACRLLTASPVVRIDGPRSVGNAFTTHEMAALFAEAGLTGARIHRRWPCRLLAVWKRPH